MQDIIHYFDHFNPEFLMIEVALLAATLALLLFLWVYNRRKFQQFQHNIPSAVVKTYLDSVIQNSQAIKSALFRGLTDLPAGIPQVLSPGALGSADSLGVTGGDEELKNRLNEKNQVIQKLETRLDQFSGENDQLKKMIEDLKNQLAQAPAGSSGDGAGPADPELLNQVQEVSKERDALKERLKEYEIIEDDLADLKRLQQENEQLKRSLGSMGGAVQAPGDKAAPVMEAATTNETAVDSSSSGADAGEFQMSADASAAPADFSMSQDAPTAALSDDESDGQGTTGGS